MKLKLLAKEEEFLFASIYSTPYVRGQASPGRGGEGSKEGSRKTLSSLYHPSWEAPGPLPALFQAILFLADRTADNPVGPVCLHHCGKLCCAVLHLEKEKKVPNDLLCDSIGHHG